MIKLSRLELLSSQVHTALIRGRLQKGFLKKDFDIVDDERGKLSISPFWISRMACLPNRFSKLDLPAILRKRAGEYQDVSDASSEARKKQILGQARTEVIKSILRAK